MSLNSKILNEIIDLAGNNFVCLRCGECCYQWAVILPDGSKKEQNQICPYLIDISKKNNRWTETKCRIYENRPEVCKKFIISFATICPIGLWKWLKLRKKQPDIRLPERVEKVLNLLKDLNNI